MSRAGSLARAFGSDGTLNTSDVAGLAAVASSGSASDLSTGTLPIDRIADTSVTAAKLHTTAVTDKLGYTPANAANLTNVENKSSATIRGELTSGNVTSALGYTPYNQGFVALDMTSLSSTTYYPVLLDNGHYHTANHITICRGYSENGFDLAYLNFEMRYYGYSWGGSHVGLYVDMFDQAYRNTLGLVGSRGYYHPIVWLRGGLHYWLRSDMNVVATVITTATKIRDNGDQYDYGVGPLTETQINNHPNNFATSVGGQIHSYGYSFNTNLNNTGYTYFP